MDEASPPISHVRQKLTELTKSLNPPTTSASIFRATPSPDFDGPRGTAAGGGGGGTGSGHRARALRSHFQKHLDDVHGVLQASEPRPPPPAPPGSLVGSEANSTVSDGTLSVLNNFQQFNFLSYFMPSFDSSDQLDQPQEQQQQSSSSSLSSSIFATSPTFFVPAQTPPPPQPQPQPQPLTSAQQKPPLAPPPPSSRQPSLSPIPPAQDDLSWVPKLRQTQRMSPSQRKELFLAAHSHVDVTVDGLSGAPESESAKRKSVLINLTPMRSYSEGGGLIGAPVTISPGALLDMGKLLSMRDGVPSQDDVDGVNDDDDDDDDDASDTKVEVDFAMNVFTDESHPGSSFPILSPRSRLRKDPAGLHQKVDNASPGPVSSLISRFENNSATLSSSSSHNSQQTVSGGIPDCAAGAAKAKSEAVPPSPSAGSDQQQRIAVLESVSQKLSLMVDHLLQSRTQHGPTSTAPTEAKDGSQQQQQQQQQQQLLLRREQSRDGTQGDGLYEELARTLAELRATLTGAEPSGGLVVDEIPAAIAAVDAAEPENTHTGVVDTVGTALQLQSQVETLRTALEEEREGSQRQAATLLVVRQELVDFKTRHELEELKARQELFEAKAQRELDMVNAQQEINELKARQEIVEAKARQDIDAVKVLREIDLANARQEIDELKAQREIDLANARQEINELKAQRETVLANARQEIDELKAQREIVLANARQEIDELKAQREIDLAQVRQELEAQHHPVSVPLVVGDMAAQTEEEEHSPRSTASVQTEAAALASTRMQTEVWPMPPAATSTTEAQTDAAAEPAVPVRSASDEVAFRELREALLESQRVKFECELRLEEALLEAEKQRLQSIMELGRMQRALDADQAGMDQLARDLEATFETLALTLVELSLEREGV